jgi:diguanylate cyclase (GGDEF)-like protein
MRTVIALSSDFFVTNIIERILSPFFRVLVFNRIDSALDFIYNEIPDMVVVEIVPGNESMVDKLNDLKGDPLFSQIPVIAVFSGDPPIINWEDLLVEDYMHRDDIGGELLLRAKLAITRTARVVEVNPLTRLPGNISINRQIQTRLDKGDSFALAYADLSEFKPFNDRYGFSRGDEVLKITGRLILNIVKSKQPEGSFVGHIGGDDFVFIMNDDLVKETCDDIISTFDNLIPTFYDPQDRENNGIESVDRRGVSMSFPFIGLAIGVTSTAGRNFSHFGQLTEAASAMKSLAKKKRGSSFSIDKRITASA